MESWNVWRNSKKMPRLYFFLNIVYMFLKGKTKVTLLLKRHSSISLSKNYTNTIWVFYILFLLFRHKYFGLININPINRIWNLPPILSFNIVSTYTQTESFHSLVIGNSLVIGSHSTQTFKLYLFRNPKDKWQLDFNRVNLGRTLIYNDDDDER